MYETRSEVCQSNIRCDVDEKEADPAHEIQDIRCRSAIVPEVLHKHIALDLAQSQPINLTKSERRLVFDAARMRLSDLSY